MDIYIKPGDTPFGMAATIGIGTDCYAATVLGASKKGPVVLSVEFDDTKVVRYFRETARRTHADGRQAWEEVEPSRAPGRVRKVSHGYYLCLGKRETYCDPSF